MTGNLNAALVLVNKLNEAYFLHRNLEIILSCFSADAHVVGVSTGEVSNGLEQIRTAVSKGLATVPFVSGRETEVLMLRERRKDLVEVSVKYTLLSQQGEPVLAPFIVTANCEEESHGWKITLIHSSMPGDYVEAFFLETKLQNVIDAIPGGVAVYRVSDVFDMQYFSKGVPELTGYTPEEYRRVIKDEPSAMPSSEDTQTAMRKLRYAAEHNASADFEFRMYHRSGDTVWVRIQAKVIGYEDGYPLLHCVYHNITARKKAELELLKARQENDRLLAEYSDSVNNSPGGLVTIEITGAGMPYPIFVSQGFLNITRMTREQFYQVYVDSAFDGLHPDDVQRVIAAYRKLQKPGDQMDDTFRLVCGDGTYVWVQARATLTEREGRRIIYIGYLDATDRIEAQKKQYLQQQALEQAIDHSNLMFWEYDCSSHTAYSGQKVQSLFGLGKIVDNFPETWLRMGYIHEEDQKTYRKAFADIDNGSLQEEFSARAKIPGSDRWIWMNFRCNVICDDTGRAIRTICTAENIDRYKELEQTFFEVMRQNGVTSWKYDMERQAVLEGNKVVSAYGLHAHQIQEGLIEGKLFHPEDAPKARLLLQHIREGEREVSGIFRVFDKKAGEYSWIRLSYTVLVDADGIRRTALGSAMDISREIQHRQKFEEMLLLHKNKKNLDTLLTGYCSLKENIIKGLNDFSGQDFGQRYGSVRDEFFTRFADAIVDEKERSQFLDTYLAKPLLADFAKGISNHNNIYYCKFRDEDEGLYVQVNVDTMLAPDKNDVIGFLTVSDMSQQVIAEKIINRVVEQEFDFIALIDIASGNIDRIIDRMGEYDHPARGENYDMRVGNGLLTYVVEEEREACSNTNTIQGILKGLGEAGNDYQTAYSIVNPKTGKRERKLWTFSYFDDTKKKVILTRTDMTATYLKEQEQQRNLSEALEFAKAANKAKSDFLAAMSHDIRTPMNAIIGMTELALSDLSDREQIHESFTTIKSSSAHLISIINDILDISRIESGKAEMLQEQFSSREEHQKIVKRIAPLAEAKGLVFTHSLDIRHDCCIGDVARLNRVVDNLLSNAIKFTPEGGRVDYSFAELPCCRPDHILCRITVTDTGIGMDEHTRACLFEPFFRHLDSAAGNVEGTGLGMSIVKSTVELSGGSIEVESEPGRGSKFIVKIPVRLADEQEVPKKEPPKPEIQNLSGITILLVEDHPINQKVAKKMLEKAGARVVVAENGKIGWEVFTESSENEYDVILMDIQMPVMDGYEAAKAIRESRHPQAKTIPIIAMTANAFVQDVKKSLDISMDAHLSKPIEPQKLFETLFRYVSK